MSAYYVIKHLDSNEAENPRFSLQEKLTFFFSVLLPNFLVYADPERYLLFKLLGKKRLSSMGTAWANHISEWHLNFTDNPCRCGKGLQNKILNAVIHWLYVLFRKFRVSMEEESSSTLTHWPCSHIRWLWVKSFLLVRAGLQNNGELSCVSSSL